MSSSLHSPPNGMFAYELEEVVGQGGMGVVYRAHDGRLKRRVALKLMSPELALDERFRERFAREAELVMSLEHPNVVPIYDAGAADGRLYLAMRYVEGTDLRKLLREEGALEPARALDVVRQVGAALDAAHAKQLVHRDVKPSNVLLDEDGHAYLADFGLTRRLTDDGGRGGDGRSLGTPAYLAPEQIEGGSIDGRADVYSLGCLLYECLTGRPPFASDSRLAVVWAHLEEEPPNASGQGRGLPPAIDAVVQRAMAKAPEERYPTCRELVDAAGEALGLAGRRRMRSRRLALTALLVLATTAAVGAAFGARGGAESAAAEPLAVTRDTLVRVDPATNKVKAVIPMGEEPTAVAVGGRRVWVYDILASTVAEVDAATNAVRHTTRVTGTRGQLSNLAGAALAADERGAWHVGFDSSSSILTKVLPGGKTRTYRFREELRAVAVARGAVWLLAWREGNFALRLDPVSGKVTQRVPLPGDSSDWVATGIAVDDGAIWATQSEEGVLHRVDLDTGSVRSRRFGGRVTAPVIGFGWVWICTSGEMVRIDPRTLRTSLSRNALPAERERFAVGYGSVWRHDVPSGSLMRFDASSGDPSGIIPLTPPYLFVTSVAAGAGGVWVAVGGD